MEHPTKNDQLLLKTATLQFAPVWEDTSHNLVRIEKWLGQLPTDTHLAILPEMATTGFSMRAAVLAETMEGDTMRLFQQWANQYNVAICGSFIVQEMAAFYNRFVFFHPNGQVDVYDKKHLFTMGDEHRSYTAGTKRKLVEYRGWKLLPIICYDLRFPVWCRNNLNYDVLLCVANWPAVRSSVWNTLLAARSIENQCYTLGCNRTGEDGNGISYNGGSKAIDAKGRIIADAGNTEQTLFVSLDKSEQNAFRAAFPVLKDGDGFTLL